MSRLIWKLSRIDRIIDFVVSIVLMVSAQLSAVYLIFALMNEGLNVDARVGITWTLVFCGIVIEFVSLVCFFAYRVNEIGRLIIVSTIWGRLMKINIADISLVANYMNFLYCFKMKDKRRIYIMNHRGGAEKVVLELRRTRNK